MEIVRRAVAAVNARDINRYLANCTEDVELRTPFASIGGVYEGPDDIRRFFDDIADTAPDFRLGLDRVETIGDDKVLAFLHVTASGRTSGIPTPAETTNLYEFVDGKISRIQIFFDRQEALKAAGLIASE